MVTAASNLLESLSRKGGSLEILILWWTRVPERKNVCRRPPWDGWCKVPRGSSSGHRSRCQDAPRSLPHQRFFPHGVRPWRAGLQGVDHFPHSIQQGTRPTGRRESKNGGHRLSSEIHGTYMYAQLRTRCTKDPLGTV